MHIRITCRQNERQKCRRRKKCFFSASKHVAKTDTHTHGTMEFFFDSMHLQCAKDGLFFHSRPPTNKVKSTVFTYAVKVMEKPKWEKWKKKRCWKLYRLAHHIRYNRKRFRAPRITVINTALPFCVKWRENERTLIASAFDRLFCHGVVFEVNEKNQNATCTEYSFFVVCMLLSFTLRLPLWGWK